jgi:purine-nucleoside phosphorylase
MYKSFTKEQYLHHLDLPEDYRVDGVVCYGTLYDEQLISLLDSCWREMGYHQEPKKLSNRFLRFIREADIDGKRIWFMNSYGGAMLSEYLHWACLFGSRKNIFVGSCGGLKSGMKTGDFLLPTSSYGQESSVRTYNREDPVQYPDEKLRASVKARLGSDVKIWEGPIMTCQAMLGETLDDIQAWSEEGYYGVEMETSTVFAVSKHFNVPAAAIVHISDNLIEHLTFMSEDFADGDTIRELRRRQQFKAAVEEVLR